LKFVNKSQTVFVYQVFLFSFGLRSSLGHW